MTLQVIAGFLLATVILGSIYILYRICLKVRSYWKVRFPVLDTLPKGVIHFLTTTIAIARDGINTSRPQTPSFDI